MDKVYDICCGIDVHKKLIVACLRKGNKHEIREFGATTRELNRLQKMLEGANIKLSGTVAEINGMSARVILNELLDRKTIDKARLQEMKEQKIIAHNLRAYVAVAHSMLIAIYHILKDGVKYQDLGAEYYNQFNRERKINAYLKKLKALGWEAPVVAT